VKRSAWKRRYRVEGTDATFASNDRAIVAKLPGFWRTALTWLPLYLISGLVLGVIFSVWPGQNRSFADVILGAPIGVVVAVALAIGSAVIRGRLRRLAEVAPSDFRFVFAKSREYLAGLAVLTGPIELECGYIARGASANASGLTIWQGNPPQSVATLAWDKVKTIQTDKAPGSNNSRDLLALITFTDDSGQLATLPLAYPKVNSFPTPSRTDVRWIVAQLNALRAVGVVPGLPALKAGD
jgi:hypothetical protein